MTRYRYAHTNTERHPYIKSGYYWKVFGHMFTHNASEELKKRMLNLKNADEKTHNKKYGK